VQLTLALIGMYALLVSSTPGILSVAWPIMTACFYRSLLELVDTYYDNTDTGLGASILTIVILLLLIALYSPMRLPDLYAALQFSG